MRVPADAYYGAQTRRAVENFPISGLTAPAELVVSTVQIKKAAAEANARSDGYLPTSPPPSSRAADEILAGKLRDQFVVDVYQAGAGTSHNMNTNEVLANRAAELLGGTRGNYTRVHPNDHVNMGQSTNDVFPTATRLALLAMVGPLVESASALAEGLEHKSRAFADVLKTGRTHLQDAVPMTLGQEFGGYAANVAHAAGDVDAGIDTAARAESRRDGGRDRAQRRRRLHRSGDRQPRELHRSAGPAGSQSFPRDAEHGRRARVFGGAAPARGRSQQGRIGPAAPQQRPARRASPRSSCRRCSRDRRSCPAR